MTPTSSLLAAEPPAPWPHSNAPRPVCRDPGHQGPRHQRDDDRRPGRLRRRHGEGQRSRAPSPGHPEIRRRTDRSGPAGRMGLRHRRRGPRSRILGSRIRARGDGQLDLKMFPSHSRHRACPSLRHHRQHDDQGAIEEVARDARIEKHSITAIVDLINGDGRVVGAWGVDYENGALVIYQAQQIILCTGGGSGLFYVNDNPPQVTGDGYVARASRRACH